MSVAATSHRSTGETALLEVDGLSVSFPSPATSAVRPVRDVSFTLRRGDRLGVVGESGSGKSLTALAVMRLIHPPGRLTGRILLEGRDLLALSDREMARVRAGELSMIYQDPMSALNPVFTIGRQVAEAIQIAEPVSSAAARARAIDLLGEVGVPTPARRYDSYPYQFSGGMRQRVMIAMALASNPSVLIADEPTTALDVTTQARVMDLLSRIVEERGLAVILITHDLGVAAGFCEWINVMYAGRIVESSSAEDLYTRPVHPYTEALLEAVCRLDKDVTAPMDTIGGQPPLPGSLPPGCTFHPRCPDCEQICTSQEPVPWHLGGERFAECHFAARRAGVAHDDETTKPTAVRSTCPAASGGVAP